MTSPDSAAAAQAHGHTYPADSVLHGWDRQAGQRRLEAVQHGFPAGEDLDHALKEKVTFSKMGLQGRPQASSRCAPAGALLLGLALPLPSQLWQTHSETQKHQAEHAKATRREMPLPTSCLGPRGPAWQGSHMPVATFLSKALNVGPRVWGSSGSGNRGRGQPWPGPGAHPGDTMRLLIPRLEEKYAPWP